MTEEKWDDSYLRNESIDSIIHFDKNGALLINLDLHIVQSHAILSSDYTEMIVTLWHNASRGVYSLNLVSMICSTRVCIFLTREPAFPLTSHGEADECPEEPS